MPGGKPNSLPTSQRKEENFCCTGIIFNITSLRLFGSRIANGIGDPAKEYIVYDQSTGAVSLDLPGSSEVVSCLFGSIRGTARTLKEDKSIKGGQVVELQSPQPGTAATCGALWCENGRFFQTSSGDLFFWLGGRDVFEIGSGIYIFSSSM